MPTNKVNNNIKLKSGGGLVNDPTNGMSLDSDFVTEYNLASFAKNETTGTAAETINTGKLYRIATSASPTSITTLANGQSTGYDWDEVINVSWALPLDKTSGYHKLNSLEATFGTVTTGGNVTAKIYKLVGSWNNSNPTATMSGAILLASTTITVSSTGTKTFTFSSPPTLDFNINKYAVVIQLVGSYSNVTFLGGLRHISQTGNGYSCFYSGDESSWSIDSGYSPSSLTFNGDTEVVGAIYLASTTVVDGVVTAGGASSSTLTLQNSGICALSGVTVGGMNYSNGTGQITNTPDGTKMSIGLGIDTNKILIIKGIK